MSIRNISEGGSIQPLQRRSDLDLSDVSIHQLTDTFDRTQKRQTKKRKVQEQASSDATEPVQPSVAAASAIRPEEAKIDFATLDPESFKDELDKACLIFREISTNRSLIKMVEPKMRDKVFWAARDLFPNPLCSRTARAHRKRKVRKETDRKLRNSTGIRQLRAQTVFDPSAFHPPLLTEAVSEDECESSSPKESPEKEFCGRRRCHICKKWYKTVHRFYDQLCPECGDFNFKKRFQTADLRGRTALVTGGRVKIGYQTVLMLLHAGAKVIVVTRFPRDAATRFGKEKDFNDWKDRLEIFGLDLRHTPSVEAFCKHL